MPTLGVSTGGTSGADGPFFHCKVNKVARGTYTASTSAKVKVTLGFRPKHLCISPNSQTSLIMEYDERISTTQMFMTNGSNYTRFVNLGGSSNYYIYSIDDDGFTINKGGNAYSFYYQAIG